MEPRNYKRLTKYNPEGFLKIMDGVYVPKEMQHLTKIIFKTMSVYITWIAVFAAIIHILEEYYCGWINWAKSFVPTVKKSHFIVVNFLFVCTCVLAAILQILELKISIFSLLIINAFVHLVPTIVKRKYSPGLVSAMLLYIPIGIFGYIATFKENIASNVQIIVGTLLGFIIMAIPFLFQSLYGRMMNKSGI